MAGEREAPQPATTDVRSSQSVEPTIETEPPVPVRPTTHVELENNPSFELDPETRAWIDHHKGRGVPVGVKYGSVATGEVIARPRGNEGYRFAPVALPLTHPLFLGLGERLGELAPVLRVEAPEGRVTGKIGLGTTAGKVVDLFHAIREVPGRFGLPGLEIPSVRGVTNQLENGRLTVTAELPLQLGRVLSGTLSVRVSNETLEHLRAEVHVSVEGLATGTLVLERDAQGAMSGTGKVDLQLPKGFSGQVELTFDGSSISGTGKVAYQGENLSGEITIHVMPRAQAIAAAEAAEAAATPAPAADGAAPTAAAPASPDGSAKGNEPRKAAPADGYAVFGSGELDFSLGKWLTGRAQVAVDHEGYITVTGEITPPAELVLFEQKDWVKELGKIEFRVAYGIPVVGNLFVFVNIGLSAFASLGPAKLYDVVIKGSYSTNPAKARELSVAASLNLSAAAGLTLAGQIGAGIEILDHDLKAGGELSGTAALEAYVQARPTIGYRQPSGEPDAKGEFYIDGDIEAAMRPVLRLGGKLFVEVDSPWWSPLPDKTWPWPLGDIEYPLPGEIGLAAHVTYVFGSGEVPAIEPKPVEFDASKLMTDVLERKTSSGGGKAKAPAKWTEKGTEPSERREAETGDPKNAPVEPKAKSDAGQSLPAKADEDGRTADGRSIAELKDKASKEPGGVKESVGGGKNEAKGVSPEVTEALATLHEITRRLDRAGGVTKEALEAELEANEQRLRGFKTLEVVSGGEDWDFDYTASPGKKEDGPKKATAAKETTTRGVEEEAAQEKGQIPAPQTPLAPDLAARRAEILRCLDKFVRVDEAFVGVKKVDPDARFAIKGSIVRGTVGNPRKETFGKPVAIDDFDLDVFVISDKLPNPGRVVGLPNARDRLYRAFPGVFEGLRPGGRGLSIKVLRSGEPMGDIVMFLGEG